MARKVGGLSKGQAPSSVVLRVHPLSRGGGEVVLGAGMGHRPPGEEDRVERGRKCAKGMVSTSVLPGRFFFVVRKVMGSDGWRQLF